MGSPNSFRDKGGSIAPLLIIQRGQGIEELLDLEEDAPEKPKGMQWRTYVRLVTYAKSRLDCSERGR
jgi:hypothetical protein